MQSTATDLGVAASLAERRKLLMSMLIPVYVDDVDEKAFTR